MIRLSRLTDYAIVLLSQMVSEGKGVYAASELSERTMLPLPTTSKVLKKLTKSGILMAQRGAGGGYKLGREADVISIASIIEAMDGPIAITDCADPLDDKACSRTEAMCPMRANWHKINEAIRAALEEVSLASMVPGTHAHRQAALAELVTRA